MECGVVLRRRAQKVACPIRILNDYCYQTRTADAVPCFIKIRVRSSSLQCDQRADSCRGHRNSTNRAGSLCAVHTALRHFRFVLGFEDFKLELNWLAIDLLEPD